MGSGAPALAHEIGATFLSRCPTVDEPKAGTQPEGLEAVAIAIAGLFVDKLVDAGIAAVKKALVPEARSVEGGFLMDGLYALRAKRNDEKIDPVIPNPELACLVVAVGEFGPGLADWELPFEVEANRKATAVQMLVDKLSLKRNPIFYFEAVRKFSTDRTAVTWQPVRLYVGDYLNDSFFAGSSRGVALEVRLNAPGESKAFLAQTFSFDSVRKPLLRSGEDYRGSSQRGTWGALPVPSKHTQSSSFKAPSSGSTPLDPFTLNVRLVESPKPYRLASMFVESVESKAGDIRKAVSEEVFPEKRKAASREAQNATLTAMAGFLTAYDAATKVCEANTLTIGSATLACSIEREKTRIAKEKAQLACDVEKVAACTSLSTVPSP
jgi:hypothetical protein